jgi:hypothetical protein
MVKHAFHVLEAACGTSFNDTVMQFDWQIVEVDTDVVVEDVLDVVVLVVVEMVDDP